MAKPPRHIRAWRRLRSRWLGFSDNPKAVNQQPAAAKVLVTLLDKLSSVLARNRGGRSCTGAYDVGPGRR